jgi:hypothetical protein
MTQAEKRNKAQYIRTLELSNIISEEWGECIQSINNYNWKGQKLEDIENAIEELQQMVSPMLELQGLLEYMVKLQKNVDK